jgi:putative ABC transport system permease protein
MPFVKRIRLQKEKRRQVPLGVTVSTANEVLDNDRNFEILEAISLAVAIIAVAMSALNVLNALVMATQERTREIGILAAIGWSNGQIMMSIVVEGIVMCVIGCVLGVLLSFSLRWRFRTFLRSAISSRSDQAAA